MAYALVYSRDGQTEDVEYFCGYSCQINRLTETTLSFEEGAVETLNVPTETDHDEWCRACGDFLWHGLECDCEDTENDREPLTEEQLNRL